MVSPAQLPATLRPAKWLAECIGTFTLVLIGCGAVLVGTRLPGSVPPLGVALAFGGVVATVIYSVGHISGAHLNPAVSLAFAALGRLRVAELCAYVVAQLVGACAAAYLLGFLVAELDPVAALGVTRAAEGVSLPALFVIEFVITALLMFVIAAVATDNRAVGELAGIAIGLWVFLAALVAGPLTGASMNPARSVGPALVAGHLEALWVYVAAPCLGAVVGAMLYRAIRCDAQVPPADGGACC